MSEIQTELTQKEISEDKFKPTNSVGFYFRQLKNLILLSPEEKEKLIYRYYVLGEKNNLIRERLINDHLLLVVSHIIHYMKVRPSNPIFMDLVQEGNKALAEGIDKYDVEKATIVVSDGTKKIKKLSSYVLFWIDARVFDWFVRNHNLVKIKNGQDRKLYFALRKMRNNSGGEDLSSEQIASLFGVSESRVDAMKSRLSFGSEVSLNSPLSGDDNTKELGDVIPDDNFSSDELLAESELLKICREEIDKLYHKNYSPFIILPCQRILKERILPSIDDSKLEKSAEDLALEMEQNLSNIQALERKLRSELQKRIIARLQNDIDFTAIKAS